MWWVTLVATLVLMGLLHLLARAGPVEARATLALGFLLVAAQLGGDLAKRVRLPLLTGFLLTGFALGPAWLGLIRDDEVRALGFIGEAALALIGFAAGSQLTFASLRRQARPLARVTAGTVVFPLAAVALVVLTVSPWFPLTVHQPVGDALAVALVLGTVAAASSPAVTIAVMDELDARGPFARAVLDVSVAKDIAAVVLFALVLVVARPLASPGAVEVGVAWAALIRLGGSVVVGAGLGALLGHYSRFVEREMRLFVVALALCLAGVARALALEPLFVALAAGFAARHLWRGPGVGSVAPLQRAAVPVYLVFFALAGATFGRDDLAFLLGVWPWVLLLAGLRAVALRYGAIWAARSPDVMPALAQGGWLGLISQAGVALGLAAAARRAFPEWGVSLEAMIVALVGVHETLGPICFRRALRLTGEVTEAEHVTDVVEAGEPGIGLRGGSVH
jgi:Kef-type K+ transport system membrane component KefB